MSFKFMQKLVIYRKQSRDMTSSIGGTPNQLKDKGKSRNRPNDQEK